MPLNDTLDVTITALTDKGDGIGERDGRTLYVSGALPGERVQVRLHGIKPKYDQRKPVFFGHYWMQGAPVWQAEQMACVDYSAGKGGPLVAYRWSGEERLSSKNFVTSPPLN